MAHNSAPLDAKRGKNAFNGTQRRTIKSRISKMLQLEQINKIIDQAIEAVGFSREPELLYAPLKYILDLGGKRLRPRFCLTTYNLFKENISEEIIKPALALEIFHNFTLIHDDIMDNAALRRGMPTVYKKWNNNVAILSGDAMCIESYRFLNQAPPDKLAQIGPLFSKTALQVCEGQQFDMDFEEMESVPMEDYIKMIGLKTAVLIACAAKMGAILGDASPSICDQIYDFGYQLGIAFQIEDDLLDSFGDEKIFGKKIGGDILNNKKTWLLIKCQNIIASGERAKLDQLLKMDPNEAKIEAVKAFFKEHKIDELAQKAIAEYNDRALEILEKMNLTPEQKLQLKRYASWLVKRNY